MNRTLTVSRSRPGRRRGILVLLAVLPIAQGCSLAFVDGPPEGHEQTAFQCTESRALPTVDLLASIASVALGLAVISATDDDPFVDDAGEAYGAVLIAGGALGGYSAYEGFKRTGACRDARSLEGRMFDALQEGVQEAGR